MENSQRFSLSVIPENKEKLKLFLEEVKKEMLLNKIYYKKAKFSCFDSDIFTYSYSNHSIVFEFSFICDDTLLSKMTIKEILELKRILFFESSMFDKKTMEKLGGTYISLGHNDYSID